MNMGCIGMLLECYWIAIESGMCWNMLCCYSVAIELLLVCYWNAIEMLLNVACIGIYRIAHVIDWVSLSR